MSLKDKLSADLKEAMLAKDADQVSVLRGLKSAILNEEVAKGIRDSGLPDEQIIALFQKEAKKRQESADLFKQGGNLEKADAELSEKQVIEQYLPAQLTEDDIKNIIDEIVAENGTEITKETMGATIAAVKAKSGGAADGALTARLVRERIAG